MSQDNTPPAGQSKHVADFVIQVGIFIQRPDKPEIGTFVECEAIKVKLLDTKNKKELPDGLLKQIREVLGEMSEMARTFEHGPLPPKKPEASQIESVPKVSGPPTMQLFRQGPQGQMVPAGRPILIDPQGQPVKSEHS